MRILFAFILSSLAAPALFAQAKVAKEPGVAVTFTAGGSTDTRTERFAALYVPKGSPATPFVPAVQAPGTATPGAPSAPGAGTGAGPGGRGRGLDPSGQPSNGPGGFGGFGGRGGAPQAPPGAPATGSPAPPGGPPPRRKGSSPRMPRSSMLLNNIATSPSASATLVLISVELAADAASPGSAVDGVADDGLVAARLLALAALDDGLAPLDDGFGVVTAGFVVRVAGVCCTGSLRVSTVAGCASFMSIKWPTRSVNIERHRCIGQRFMET